MYGLGSDRGDKTRRSVMAAAGAMRSFANAPGRKVMLLLIEGWATVSDTWNFRSAYAAASAGATLDRFYSPLVNAANLVGYSLYPIDLPGFQGSPGPPIAGFGTAGVAPFAGAIGAYSSWRAVPERRFHDVLHFLAEETGGLPMINSFSKKALAETAEDTRSYYWLGFEPPRNEDDRLHDIAVRLPRHRDLRVRTREHYLDMSRATEVGMLVEGALLLGGTPGAESLEVSFGEPRKASGFRRLDVPMKVTVRLDDVELLPVDGQWANDLEFRIRLMNKWGDQAAPPAAKVQVRIPNEPMPGDLYVFETDLTIRKRRPPLRRGGLRPADRRHAVGERHRRAEVAAPDRPKQGAPLRFLIVPFAILGLAASPGAGQDVPLPDLFADTIDVRVVNVEVVVTDHEGYRIQGLEASDFELLVDGQPVPISYFTEVDDGHAMTSLEDGWPQTLSKLVQGTSPCSTSTNRWARTS